MSDLDAGPEPVRLDVWLWRARFFKTKAAAGEFVAKGKVRVTRFARTARVEKPHYRVTPGDQLTFSRAERAVWLEIEGLGARRGPAEEARGLYRLLDPSCAAETE